MVFSAFVAALPKFIETGSEVWQLVQRFKKNLQDKGLWTNEYEEALVQQYGQEILDPAWQPRED